MRLVSARYRLLYRILVMCPKSSMSVTKDELIDADITTTSSGAYAIGLDLGIRAEEYKIKAFKQHLRITRL
jgi:hypothetical protein